MIKNRPMAIIFVCLLRLSTSNAQDKPADAPVHRVYTDLTFLSGVRAEYYYKENSCVFYNVDYNINEEYRYRITNSTRLYNRLGIEANPGGKWYVGASLSHRLAYDQGLNMGTIKANVSHRGAIGSLQFIKELSAEYIHHFNYTFFDKKKDIQAGIGAALYKDLKLFKRPLGFMLSYKVLINSNLEFDIYKDRNIDFTRLRTDIFYGITPSIYVGVFVMRETEYYYPLGTSDEYGNNIYRKINHVLPVVGVNLNFVIKPDNIQHYIPGLPLR